MCWARDKAPLGSGPPQMPSNFTKLNCCGAKTDAEPAMRDLGPPQGPLKGRNLEEGPLHAGKVRAGVGAGILELSILFEAMLIQTGCPHFLLSRYPSAPFHLSVPPPPAEPGGVWRAMAPSIRICTVLSRGKGWMGVGI